MSKEFTRRLFRSIFVLLAEILCESVANLYPQCTRYKHDQIERGVLTMIKT